MVRLYPKSLMKSAAALLAQIILVQCECFSNDKQIKRTWILSFQERLNSITFIMSYILSITQTLQLEYKRRVVEANSPHLHVKGLSTSTRQA